MISVLSSLALLSLSTRVTMADITPTAPGPGDSFKSGSSCTVTWTPDSQGVWTNVTIWLMSGSNSDMQPVTTVVQQLDGTSKSSHQWTCPDVQPYSAIYFYQFTNGDDKQSSKWTTRFSITSASGELVSFPEHQTQPNGDAIPWGVGTLTLPSKVKYDTQDSSNATSTMTTSISTNGASVPSIPADFEPSTAPASSTRMHRIRPTHDAHWDSDAVTTLSLPCQNQLQDSGCGENIDQSDNHHQAQAPFSQADAFPVSGIQSVNSARKPSGESVQWMLVLCFLLGFVSL